MGGYDHLGATPSLDYFVNAALRPRSDGGRIQSLESMGRRDDHR